MKKILASMFVFAIMIGCLAACAVAPKTPAQSIYLLENDFRVALTIAVTYKELPKCGTGIKLCSDPGIVHRLQDAYDVADAALKAAQTTVRAGGGNSKMAITAAQQALIALTSITSTLGVK